MHLADSADNLRHHWRFYFDMVRALAVPAGWAAKDLLRAAHCEPRVCH